MALLQNNPQNLSLGDSFAVLLQKNYEIAVNVEKDRPSGPIWTVLPKAPPEAKKTKPKKSQK